MKQTEYEKKFLGIALANPEIQNYPGAAHLLIEAIEEQSIMEGLTFEKMAVEMSKWVDFGQCGEIGGVNVYRGNDGSEKVEFTSDIDSTWMSLEYIVRAVDDGVDDWFDSDWIQKLEN